MGSSENEAIRQVIEKAYIQGIHGNQDEDLVRGGFHPDFAMLVLQDNVMRKVTVGAWLERLEEMKAADPQLWGAETAHKFLSVDATGDAAVAILEVFKGETHFSTDYMLLYRFEDGWKIVSKIFAVPQGT